jgi:hypothetical protein
MLAAMLPDETQEMLLTRAYAAFNARDIDAVLALMRDDVAWPNGMEGGYVHGLDAVRAYWLRQWTMVDPRVEPVAFVREADGRVRVEVHQVVRDLGGALLVDQKVLHVYRFEGGRIADMEIRAAG